MAAGAVPTALRGLDGCQVKLGTGEEEAIIEFRNEEDAALAAVALWTAMPQRLSLADVLALRFADGLQPTVEAVKTVLVEQKWREFVGTVD